MTTNNPLESADFHTVLQIFKDVKDKLAGEDIIKINKLILTINVVKNRVKNLLHKIERYERETGFSFIKESQRIL